MNRDKYVGMDVDQATIVAHVTDGDGKFLMETFLKTKAEGIRQFLRSLEGRVHVAFEEGQQASWLYDIIRPLVTETIVCDARRNKTMGSKGDRIDARKICQWLRLGELHAVYHGQHGRELKELVHCYSKLVGDTTRTMNRLKSLFRGQGIVCRGQGVYNWQRQEEWKSLLKSEALRTRADLLYKQLEVLKALREEAKKAMLEEARRQTSNKLLLGVPGIGRVRAAMMMGIVGTPHRFRTKRQYWGYCGFGVVTHMSGEYEIKDGRRERRKKPLQTRGLNDNFNRRMKAVYKGAAVTAISAEPFKSYYQRMIDNKMRSEMAILTVARKIAAISLAIWKKGDKFQPGLVNQAQSAGDEKG